MKHILDSDFRYRPSFDTDVKKTFEKIRRQQQQAKEQQQAKDRQGAVRIAGEGREAGPAEEGTAPAKRASSPRRRLPL